MYPNTFVFYLQYFTRTSEASLKLLTTYSWHSLQDTSGSTTFSKLFNKTLSVPSCTLNFFRNSCAFIGSGRNFDSPCTLICISLSRFSFFGCLYSWSKSDIALRTCSWCFWIYIIQLRYYNSNSMENKEFKSRICKLNDNKIPQQKLFRHFHQLLQIALITSSSFPMVLS